MPVIQTWYAESYFRSRLEARWAVFFDTLGIRWEYEKEGYVFGDGTKYLPDFWLPVQKRWIEIKGGEPTQEEIDKASCLAEETMRPVHIFFGPIPDMSGYELPQYIALLPDEWNGEVGVVQDEPHVFGECQKCGMFDIQYTGRVERFKCDCYSEEKDGDCSNYHSTNLDRAYAAARSARFEHNEHGSIISRSGILY